MPLKVAKLQLGPIATNCYFVTDEETDQTAVIDPGDWPEEVNAVVDREKFDVRLILLTHGHYDHTGAVAGLHEHTGAPVYMNHLDLDLYENRPADLEILNCGEGDLIPLGSAAFRVLHTPGHTRGSVVFLTEDGKMFSGDTLFFTSCGRTDFPGGSYAQMLRSLKRLAELPGDYDVFPGHDRATKLSIERQYNPFMREAMTT